MSEAENTTRRDFLLRGAKAAAAIAAAGFAARTFRDPAGPPAVSRSEPLVGRFNKHLYNPQCRKYFCGFAGRLLAGA